MVSEIKLAIVISATQRGFKAFSKAEGAVNKLKAAVSAIRTELGVLAGGAAIGAISDSLRVFAQFDDVMTKISAIAIGTTDDFDKLEETIRELGRSTIFTASEVGEAAFSMSKAGQTMIDINQNLGQVLIFAQAGFLEMGDAADILSKIMASMNIPASALEQTINDIVIAANLSTTSVAQMSEAIRKAAPLANLLGISIRELAATFSALAKRGFEGEEAGTGLSRALSELAGPTGKSIRILEKHNIVVRGLDGSFVGLSDIINQLGESLITDGEIFQLFGERAGRIMATLITAVREGKGTIDEFTNALATTDKTAKAFADTVEESAGNQFKIFKAAIDDIKISLGEKLFPAVQEFMELITDPEGIGGKFLATLGDSAVLLLDTFVLMLPIMNLFLIIINQIIIAINILVSLVIGLFIGIAKLINLIPGIDIPGVDAALKSVAGVAVRNIEESFIFKGGKAIQSRQRGGLIREGGIITVEKGERIVPSHRRGQDRGGRNGRTLNVTVNNTITQMDGAEMFEQTMRYERRLRAAR